MQVKTIANAESARTHASSTRKVSAKRARSPEPTPPVDSDAAEPKSKRSKQAKAKGDTKSGSGNGSASLTKQPTPQVNESRPPVPVYLGNFDLYHTGLPVLSKLYLQNGAANLQYEEIYKAILTYQVKDANNAQFFLAPPTVRVASYLTSPAIMDEMLECPFEIVIKSITHHASLSLPSDKLPSIGPARGPGISASASLGGGRCGIRSASGVFKLKRVWAKAVCADESMELFAGYFTFNVSHGGMYKKAGYGPGQKHKWGFWAVRARTGDDGREVGLQPMLPVSARENAGTPLTDPVAAVPKAAGNSNL